MMELFRICRESEILKNGKEMQTAGKKLKGVYCLFVLFSSVGDGPIMLLMFMSGSDVIREAMWGCDWGS